MGDSTHTADEEGLKIPCWNCGAKLKLVDEKQREVARLVQCPKCKALSDIPKPRRPRTRLQNTTATVMRVLKWVLNNMICLPFVSSACLYVIIIGFLYVLPLSMSHSSPATQLVCYGIAAWLSVNTLFNYILCIMATLPKAAKKPEEIGLTPLSSDASEFPFENVRWCSKCERMKPERTHHCSMCRECVPALDHHCIFTARCVGRHNHRPFLLFLFYLVVSTIYSNIMTFVAMQKHSFILEFIHLFVHNFFIALSNIFGTSDRVPLKKMTFTRDELVTSIILMFDISLCIATTFAVGFLLFTQIRQIRLGVTQFEYAFVYPLPEKNNRGNLMDNLDSVLGRNRLKWFLPLLSTPSPVRTKEAIFDQPKSKKLK